MFSRKAVSMHPEDQRIVEIAKELCGQLNFSKLNPRTIGWKERMGVRHFPPDYILIYPGGYYAGTILLSKAAMGRLTPEEWKPFIASGLIYFKTFSRDFLRILLTTIIPYTLIVYPIVLVLTFDYLGGSSLPVLIARDTIIIALIIGVILLFLQVLARWKKLFFKADDQASILVGKEALLSTFSKMASIDGRSGGGRRGIMKPSLEERIDKLTSSTARLPA